MGVVELLRSGPNITLVNVVVGGFLLLLVRSAVVAHDNMNIIATGRGIPQIACTYKNLGPPTYSVFLID
jgi:hypothetical protein